MSPSPRPSAPDRRSNPRVPFELSNERKKLFPPQGKPLIVHVVVNVEYWQFDQPMPRTIVAPPHGRSHIPDIPNFSWSEYGNRCGMPRLLHALNERKLPVSVSINASVLEIYPNLARAVRDAGWEFVGHGIHQRSLGGEHDEKGLINDALSALRAFTGKRSRGWMSPGWSETFDTPDLLREAGIEYVCQWVIDDLPTWLHTEHGNMIAMPYGLDLNDSVVYAIEKQSSSEMSLRIEQTVQAFERDFQREKQPRVLTLPLHPHLSGVPHRIGYLERSLDMLLARPDTVFMNGSAIADWFIEESRRLGLG
jgi:allantoinase